MNISYQFHMKHPNPLKNNIIIEIWFLERTPWTHASIFIKSHTAASGVLADYHKYWEIRIILVTHHRLTSLSNNSPSSIFLHQIILARGTSILFLHKSWMQDQTGKDETNLCTEQSHLNLLTLTCSRVILGKSQLRWVLNTLISPSMRHPQHREWRTLE